MEGGRECEWEGERKRRERWQAGQLCRSVTGTAPAGLTLRRELCIWSMVLCSHHLEIFNNFIFEFVLGKSSLKDNGGLAYIVQLPATLEQILSP